MTVPGKILITGASGYIGRALQSKFASDQIIPLCGNKPIAGGRRFDALKDSLADIIDDPQSISHCIILHAWVQVDKCAGDPDGAREVNMASAIRAIYWCAVHGVVPVFVSSEAVFGNDGALASNEQSVPAPCTLYGRMKVEVEDYLRSTNIDHAHEVKSVSLYRDGDPLLDN
jgi:dTDP-4-dehydrorhamnose reductase